MTGVFFLSHIFNDFTLKQYQRLKNSLLKDFELIWVHNNEPPKDFFDNVYYPISHYLISNLPKNYFDIYNANCPNNIYIFSSIYEAFPKYDYYWFIEYDVSINNIEHSFKEVFSYYHNPYNPLECDADLICDHLNTYSTSHNYNLRYPYEDVINKYKINKFKKEEILFGFLTICRISNKLLEIMNSNEYKQIHHGFFEWLIPSIANQNHLKICTLNNLYTFEFFCPNQIVPHWFARINRGTNCPHIEFLCQLVKFIKFLPINMILHPIKSEEFFNLIYNLQFDTNNRR